MHADTVHRRRYLRRRASRCRWLGGEEGESGRWRPSVSLRLRGTELTDWKQPETFMAAVSRATINPLSRLFIVRREREFLICVKIVPRDRIHARCASSPPKERERAPLSQPASPLFPLAGVLYVVFSRHPTQVRPSRLTSATVKARVHPAGCDRT